MDNAAARRLILRHGDGTRRHHRRRRAERPRARPRAGPGRAAGRRWSTRAAATARRRPTSTAAATRCRSARSGCCRRSASGTGVADRGAADPRHQGHATGAPGEGPSPFVLEFDHAEIEEGPMGHMVEDRHLRPALLDAHRGAPRAARPPGRRGVRRRRPGRRGLDGRRCRTAAALRRRCWSAATGGAAGIAARAGIRRTGWDYGQTALVCAIAHERPHDGIAHQFFMPEGPLAILPLTGNRSSIVWTERSAQAAARSRRCDDAGYLAALRPRFGDFLGEIALAGRPLHLSAGAVAGRPLRGATAWRWWATRRTACTRSPGRA